MVSPDPILSSITKGDLGLFCWRLTDNDDGNTDLSYIYNAGQAVKNAYRTIFLLARDAALAAHQLIMHGGNKRSRRHRARSKRSKRRTTHRSKRRK
jgi:hypothetical protein